MGCIMFGKKLRVGTRVPLWIPTTAEGREGILVGRLAFNSAWGAGMIRGSMQVQEEVIACECVSIEDSPMTAKRETISNRHPFPSSVPVGNQFEAISPFRQIGTLLSLGDTSWIQVGGA